MPKETFGKIIPKPKPKTPLLVSWLFYFSIILLIASMIVPLFLKSRVADLEQEKKKTEQEIAGLAGEAEKELKEELSSLATRIKIFKELFDNHQLSSSFFSLLENSCHPKIQFTRLDLDLENHQVNLEGKTDGFQFLGEQLLVLKELNKDVANFNLSNISLDREGKVKFVLTLSFSPEVTEQ